MRTLITCPVCKVDQHIRRKNGELYPRICKHSCNGDGLQINPATGKVIGHAGAEQLYAQVIEEYFPQKK